MKLLLINAINTNIASETVFPNLGLGYIAAYLHKFIRDIDIRIIDSNGKNISGLLKDSKPEMVGISSVSQNFDYVSIISKECNNLKIPVFVGGIHISTLPESLPESCEAGIIGEGEVTVLELIKCFLKDKLKKDSLRNIPGLVFRDDSGELTLTKDRGFIDNLDELPHPERKLLNIQKNGFLHLFTTRGCRYRCSFCSNSRFWKQIRFFSAKYIFEELNQLMSVYSPRAVTFYDDDFLASRDRLRELADLICSARFNSKTEFNLMTRADAIDKESVDLLKRMNVTVVSLGLESGSKDTLEFLKCKTSSIDKNMEAVDLLSRAGIFTYGFFIIGAPKETEKDINQTYRFIRKSSLAGISVYTLVPYPGTPIWEYAKKRNLVSDSMRWNRLALNINEAKNDVILLSENLSRERLYKLYWKFQRLRKRMHAVLMIKRAIRNPGLIIPRLIRSFSHYLKLFKGQRNGLLLD